MNKNLLTTAVATALLGMATTSQAADLGVGVKAGLLGLGAELTVGLTDTLNARVGHNAYTFKTTGTESDIKYDIDMKWQSTGLMLDWHPRGGGFRVTAGYMLNGNKLEMGAQESASYDIGDTTYEGDISLNSRVSFNDAPYIGIGWGNAAKRQGFGFTFDAGAMYQSSPKVRLRGTCDATVSSLCDGFADDLKREERNLESDLDSFKWYPQVAFGVSYSF